MTQPELSSSSCSSTPPQSTRIVAKPGPATRLGELGEYLRALTEDFIHPLAVSNLLSVVDDLARVPSVESVTIAVENDCRCCHRTWAGGSPKPDLYFRYPDPGCRWLLHTFGSSCRIVEPSGVSRWARNLDDLTSWRMLMFGHYGVSGLQKHSGSYSVDPGPYCVDGRLEVALLGLQSKFREPTESEARLCRLRDELVEFLAVLRETKLLAPVLRRLEAFHGPDDVFDFVVKVSFRNYRTW